MADTDFYSVGFWWDSTDSENRWPGTLTFDLEDGANLKITYESDEGFSPPTLDKYDVIQGETINGKSLSLLGCFDRSVKGSFSGLGTKNIYANTVIDGLWVSDRDPLISEVEVLYQNINAWMQRSSIKVESSSKDRYLDIKYEGFDRISVYQGEDLRLEIYSSPDSCPVSPNIDGTIGIREEMRFRILPHEDRPLSYFTNIIRTIQDLLSISCLRLCQTDRVTLVINPPATKQNKDARPEVGTLHALPMFSGPKKQPGHWFDFLFNFIDIEGRIADVFDRWLGIAEKLRPVCGLYFTALYGGHNLDGKFLSLAQATEVYHRRFRPGTYMESALLERDVLPPIKSAIPQIIDPTFQDAIENRFKYLNEYSLRKRLKLIFDEHSQSLDKLVPKCDSLIETIRKYRNHLTHYTENSTSAIIDTNTRLRCMYILQLVLELSFLKEMGFSDKEIMALVNKCNTYQRKYSSELFKEGM